MPTATLRPNSTLNTALSVVGAASEHVATADELDSTYFVIDGLNTAAEVGMTTFTLPAGALVERFRYRVRAKEDSGGGIEVYIRDNGGTAYSAYNPHNTTTSWVTYNGDYVNQALTQTQINNLSVDCANSLFGIGGATNLSVSRIYLDVDYIEAPSAPTVSLPSGTQTTTRKPLVDWTYNGGAGTNGQGRFEVKIFTDAVYNGGGFDPSTSSPVLTSGQVTSSTTQWTPTSNLADGDTYRAYVRTAERVNGQDS